MLPMSLPVLEVSILLDYGDVYTSGLQGSLVNITLH